MKEEGDAWHPQAFGFASSCPLLISYHIMFHIKQINIFISMILLVPAKWLVIQTDDIIVSTKMQTLVIIGEPFYSRSKYVQRNTIFILFCDGIFNDMGFAMVPLT